MLLQILSATLLAAPVFNGAQTWSSTTTTKIERFEQYKIDDFITFKTQFIKDMTSGWNNGSPYTQITKYEYQMRLYYLDGDTRQFIYTSDKVTLNAMYVSMSAWNENYATQVDVDEDVFAPLFTGAKDIYIENVFYFTMTSTGAVNVQIPKHEVRTQVSWDSLTIEDVQSYGYSQGYREGYLEGEQSNDAYDAGFEAGKKWAQEHSSNEPINNVFTLLGLAFEPVNNFLNIEIFPGLKMLYIVLSPFVIAAVFAIFKVLGA